MGTLRLPSCPIPRPGDDVLWYEGGILQHGVLMGSTQLGAPRIQRDSGLTIDLISYDSIRTADHQKPDQPMWLSLPPGSIWRPTSEESVSLTRLGDHTVYPGPSHRELAFEIWTRGFEVFFTGEPLRKALLKNDITDAELITTMPIGRLRTLLEDMYGEEQLFVADPRSDNGRIRVGTVVGSLGPFVNVSLFRIDFANKEYAYGSSFDAEVSFSDFAFNAVYFDPINKALIDPTGNGLSDARDRYLRPVPWADAMPASEKVSIGLEVIRQCLLGCTLCPGHEKELLRLVQILDSLTVIDLANAFKIKVFWGLEQYIEDFSMKIEELLKQNNMSGLWLNKIQPAITQMKASL
jgi:hypothetical protein